MFEKEEIEKKALKWVKDVFPNDEFKQSGISRALVEFAELGYNKANEWHYPSKGEYPKECEKMTKEEIKQKTSLCFLLNQNVPEEEKNYVIERVMSTKATIVSKAALCNIITYILKQNEELKSKNC